MYIYILFLENGEFSLSNELQQNYELMSLFAVELESARETQSAWNEVCIALVLDDN